MFILRRIYAGILVLLLFGFLCGQVYGEVFSYRVPVTINSSLDLSNFQVSFVLNTSSLISAGKMRSDCGDLRVYDSDGVTSLPYWIDDSCNTTQTRVWVKVPSIPSGSKVIYVYYGNSSLSSQSNGDNVFEFFDDFNDGSLNLSKWDPVSGLRCNTYILENNGLFATQNPVSSNCREESYGEFRISWNKDFDTIYEEGVLSGWIGRGLRSVNTFSLAEGFWIETYVRVHSYNPGSGFKGFGLVLTLSRDKDNRSDIIWKRDDLYGTHMMSNIREINGNYSSSYSSSSPPTTDQLYRLKYGVVGNTHLYNFAGISGSFTNDFTGPARVGFSITTRGTNSYIDASWYWFFVRKYASSEPQVSVGSEENVDLITVSDVGCSSSLRINEVGSCFVTAQSNYGTLRYRWTSEGAQFSSPQSAETDVLFSSSGSKVINLEVYLEEYPQYVEVYQFNVEVSGSPYDFPEFLIRSRSSLSGAVPLTVILSAEGDVREISQYDPQIVYEWDFGDGSPKITGKRLVAYTYKVAGNYTVRLKVTDRYGNQAEDSVNVVVEEPQDLLVRSFKVYYSNPYRRVPLRVMVRPVLSYMPGLERVVSQSWSVGTSFVSDRATAVMTFNEPGEYQVNFSGVTNYGKNVIGSLNIAVNPNQLPSCTMDYQDYPSYGYTKFTPNCVDSDGRVVSYYWEFGNGETSKSKIGYAHYSQGGDYNVKLTVKDNSGESKVFSWSVSVSR